MIGASSNVARMRGHGELYDGFARKSRSLLIGGFVGLAQELPSPGQQFVQVRNGKIHDTGEDSGERGLGSTSLRRQVVFIVSMMAARSAPRWLPAKVQLRLPNAMPLNARSAQLLVKQILPSSRKQAKSSQLLSM